MAVGEDVKKQYLPTVGIECHVQLNTKTKLFSAVDNDARQAPPNTLISHIDTGLPGALPVLNQMAIELCAKAALALGTKPQKFSRFERKHYFYPDLPKGYQITQLEDSIIKGGYLDIPLPDGLKRVNIERANLEEDAGKNTHPAGADYSLVDLNRAGTPLLEIVSRPDIHSPAEAKAYAREMWLNMKYAGVTDGDLFLGHVRFDVNISVSKDPNHLGKRAEIKNLNSFRSVENAVAYEIERQIELLEKGQPVVQETRGWDESKQKTTSQRSKEEAQDYRYMPEPDIPPLELSEEWIESISQDLPKLPSEIRKILDKSSISPKVIEDVLDQPSICQAVLSQVDNGDEASVKRLVFWLLQSRPEETAEGTFTVNAQHVRELSRMLDNHELNSNAAQAVFNDMLTSGQDPKTIAEAKNLLQVSDVSAIEAIVADVLNQNPKAAQDVKAGEAKAIGFLVGQVMKASQGKANPQLTAELIKKQLGL